MPTASAWRELTATAQGGERAAALVRGLTGLPHAGVRGLFDHGCVCLGETPCADPGAVLAAGETLRVRYEPGRRYRPKPGARGPIGGGAFRLVYEDAHLLVVDKTPGVLTVPNHGETDTLLDAVRGYLGRSRRRPPRVAVVHRLDRDTSGLLVFAKRDGVAHRLREQFAAHKPQRVYHAIVAGRLAADAGTFRSNLATDAALNQHSTDDPDEGKPAVTHYRVVRRLAGATVVKVRLETGRRNQIRVHFAEAGHPVLGDTRYSPELARHPRWRLRRLALHAESLAFEHPVTAEPVAFNAPLPATFETFEGTGKGGRSAPVRKRRKAAAKR